MAGTLDIISADFGTDQIHHHAGLSATIIETFTPGVQIGVDVSWDGKFLYYYDSTTGQIVKARVASGFSSATTAAVVTAAALGYTPSGFEMIAGNLVVKQGAVVRQYLGFSSIKIDEWTLPGADHTPSGLAWDHINEYLLVNTQVALSTAKSRRYVGFTTTEVDNFTHLSADAPSGITWVGGNAVLGRNNFSSGDDFIDVHAGFSSSVTSTFNSENTQLIGLTWMYDPDEFGTPGGEEPGGEGATIRTYPEPLPFRFSERDFAGLSPALARSVAARLNANFEAAERQLLALDQNAPENRNPSGVDN